MSQNTAGTFEKLIKGKLIDSKGRPILQKPINFGKLKKLYTSVDANFIYDSTLYYVEVNTYNVPKPLIGQYILLNQLFDKVNEESLKKYTLSNTKLVLITKAATLNRFTIIKYLDFVNKKFFKGNGLKYIVIEYDDTTFCSDLLFESLK